MEVAIHPAARLSKLAAVERFRLAVEAALTTLALVPIAPSTTIRATMHMRSPTTTVLVGVSVY